MHGDSLSGGNSLPHLQPTRLFWKRRGKKTNLFVAKRSLRLLCALLISHRCRNAAYIDTEIIYCSRQTLFAERFARACIRYQIFTFHLVRAAIHPPWTRAPMKILSLRPPQRFANICAQWLLLERDPSGNVCLGGTSTLLLWSLNQTWFHFENIGIVFCELTTLHGINLILYLQRASESWPFGLLQTNFELWELMLIRERVEKSEKLVLSAAQISNVGGF